MKNVKYDFSSVHVELPEKLSDSIIAWGRKYIHDDDIFVAPNDPAFGREDEIHVTIMYGLHAKLPHQCVSLLEGTGGVDVRLGKLGIFTSPQKYDVVMIELTSERLFELNALLARKVKNTTRFPVYHPHVTVAYVKKGRGWKHYGLDKWDGVEFVCDEAIFSSKDGEKTPIRLSGEKPSSS